MLVEIRKKWREKSEKKTTLSPLARAIIFSGSVTLDHKMAYRISKFPYLQHPEVRRNFYESSLAKYFATRKILSHEDLQRIVLMTLGRDYMPMTHEVIKARGAEKLKEEQDEKKSKDTKPLEITEDPFEEGEKPKSGWKKFLEMCKGCMTFTKEKLPELTFEDITSEAYIETEDDKQNPCSSQEVHGFIKSVPIPLTLKIPLIREGRHMSLYGLEDVTMDQLKLFFHLSKTSRTSFYFSEAMLHHELKEEFLRMQSSLTGHPNYGQWIIREFHGSLMSETDMIDKMSFARIVGNNEPSIMKEEDPQFLPPSKEEVMHSMERIFCLLGFPISIEEVQEDPEALNEDDEDEYYNYETKIETEVAA